MASSSTPTTSTSPKPTNNSQIRVGSCSTGGLLRFGVYQPRFWRPPTISPRTQCPLKSEEPYFCEPRSPWQRPTNEQTNGLLRRWLPKGTNLNIGQARLALIQDSINMMPRKLHDWNSALSVYTELCRNDR